MTTNRKTLADSVNKARLYLLNKVPFKLIFIITGLLATVWFLLRVIPKPSRAGYPCMRAAAPFMSGFVLYLLSFTTSFFALRQAKTLLRKRSYITALSLAAIGIVAGVTFFVMNNQKPAMANIMVVNEPPDGANNPIGEGHGVFPGRVIWAWNPEATNAGTNNTPGNSFWDYKNNDTLIIRNMVDESIIELTGAKNFQAAWDSIFMHQNKRKHNESRKYQATEKIFIKINQGTAQWVLTQQEKDNGYAWPTSGGINAINPSWRRNNYAATETGPFVVLNILRQLVYFAGVPQENIAVGDPMSNIFKHNYQVWYDEFPDVKYVDKFSANHKRTLIRAAAEPAMEYSDDGAVIKEVFESYFDMMQAADYMINVACLKPHIRGGVTLTAKNHFGSITRSGAGHLHPSLISTSNNGLDRSNEGYRKYRVLVDIMGHKYLGGNTMLFVIEGLFGGSDNETRPPRKWNMAPFNGDWTNSIFMSLDQVALESVCYDFLREEFNGINQPESHPNWLGVDDYLHQAADKTNWPTDFEYNPDGEGPLKGLGVHEHWNNPSDKKYSRNLGTGNGIELIQVSGVAVSTPNMPADLQAAISAYPNPFTDQLTMAFQLDAPANVSLRIVDMQGKTVFQSGNQPYQSGVHHITWNAGASELTAGIYVVNMIGTSTNGNFSQSLKVQFAN